jgi:hypothetical protein
MRVEAELWHSVGVEETRPMTNPVSPAVASSAHLPDGLDWQRFSATSFPGRRRHDLEALTAYGAYRRSHAVGKRTAEEPARINGGPRRLDRAAGPGRRARRGPMRSWREALRLGAPERFPHERSRLILGVRSPRLAGVH